MEKLHTHILKQLLEDRAERFELCWHQEYGLNITFYWSDGGQKLFEAFDTAIGWLIDRSIPTRLNIRILKLSDNSSENWAGNGVATFRRDGKVDIECTSELGETNEETLDIYSKIENALAGGHSAFEYKLNHQGSWLFTWEIE